MYIDHMRAVPGPTGIAHIPVDDSGENNIVVVPLVDIVTANETEASILTGVG